MREFKDEIPDTPVDLMEIWPDLKRVLRVQIKELIHTVEDLEFAAKQQASTPAAAIVRKTSSSHRSHVA